MKRLKKHKIILVLSLLIFILYPTHKTDQEYVWAENGTNKEYTAITYNIHHGKTRDGKSSIDKMVNLIKSQNPDFVALQEVDRYSVRSGMKDQIKQFSERLNMYQTFYPNINIGVLQYGNGILSRYPILESGKIDLASKKEPRSILWAKVLTEKGNLYVTSIHLGLAEEERELYFQQIEQFIHDTVGDNPVLIMGDFNTLPVNDNLNALRSKVTGKLIHSEITSYKHRMKDIQIDYIFGRDIIEGKKYHLPSNASDHFPIIMKFKIGKSSYFLSHSNRI